MRPPCTVPGCGREARSRGMCGSHYGNLMRYGHAVAIRHWPVRERLSRIGWDITESGCWEWRGRRHEHGYGLLNHARVHRLMYEDVHGPIPDGRLEVRHACDNPSCLNPDHLLLGTHAENMRDIRARGRALKGRCPAGHDRTAPGAVKVIERRGDVERICVECNRARQRRYNAKRRAAA